MRQHRMMEKLLVAASVVSLFASKAHAQEFSARLNGFEELGAQNAESGAIHSNGKGTLELTLDRDAGTLTYTLTYSNVGTTPPGTGTVTQSHIHFGKEHVAGAVMVFLCTNLGNGPAGTPTCPANGGVVTGRRPRDREAERERRRLQGARRRSHLSHRLRQHSHHGLPGGRDPRSGPRSRRRGQVGERQQDGEAPRCPGITAHGADRRHHGGRAPPLPLGPAKGPATRPGKVGRLAG